MSKPPGRKSNRFLKKKIFSTVQKWFGVLETYSNVLSDVTPVFPNVLQTYCNLEIGCFKYHATLQVSMQVSTYITAGDYETLGKHKPKEFETVPQYMAEILRNKAKALRFENTEPVKEV